MQPFSCVAPSTISPDSGDVKSCAQEKYTLIRDVSADKRDKAWDSHKAAADDVAGAYMRLAVSRTDCCGNMVSETELDATIYKHGSKMRSCASWLKFAATDDGIKLTDADFCRCQTCPSCQWRRSMRWKARMWEALPGIMSEYQDARWIFLTLTVKNCDVKETKPTLQMMNRAWNKMLKREECEGVLGYFRTTEVTRGKDGTAHPHFHALLMVKRSMLTGRGYVPQKRWREMWQECCGLDYDPVVDVRTVKERAPRKGKGKGADDDVPEGVSVGLARAVKEVTKYTTKEAMRVGKKPKVDEWYYELAKQLYRARLISTGGVIREALKVTEEDEAGKETNDDLLMQHEEKDEKRAVSEFINFGWNARLRRYVMTRRYTDEIGF